MSIADQITRLNNAKAAIKTSIENKGVEVSDTALLDEYPALIDSIEVGSGDSTDSSYYYVYLSKTQNGTNYRELFQGCSALTELDLSNWDTSNATDMNTMFNNCASLTSLDLSNWNTNKVTNMSCMFDSCINLSKINGIENLDTSKVTNMSCMFNYCAKLITLDLSSFNTSKVTNMSYMFNGCSNLEEVDLSNFDMTNVSGMFSYCYELHTLRLDNCSNATISKIVNSASLPIGTVNGTTRKIYCKQENITGLTAPNGWVFVDYMTGEEIVPEMPEEPDVPLYVSGQFKNKSEITEVNTIVNDTHTSLGSMFDCCINLATIIGIEDWDTSNVTDMSMMFNYCAKLTTLDLSSFDTSKVTNMSFMFNGCSNLEEVDLRNFDISNTTNVNIMFGSCYELRTLRLDNCSNATISKIVTSSSLPTGTVNGTTRIIYCKEENITGFTAPNGWVFSFVTEEEPEVPVDPPAGDIPLYVPGEFAYSSATEITTMVNESHTDLSSMFDWCGNLVSVNTQDWDTCNVTNMAYMFNYCQAIESVDLSNWDTSSLSNTMFMFESCTNLKSVDVSGWTTSNMTTMDGMFARCSSLITINGISNWDVSNATSIGGMFRECTSLESLDLSNWVINNPTINSIFADCTSLRTLRLDNCSYDTISKILNSADFPASNQGNIYCKAENAANLTLPEGFNWTFNYIE